MICRLCNCFCFDDDIVRFVCIGWMYPLESSLPCGDNPVLLFFVLVFVFAFILY